MAFRLPSCRFMRKRLSDTKSFSRFRSRALGILAFLLISGSATGLRADIVSVGQFGIEWPSVEAVGVYGFTVTNLTGNSSSGTSYPVTTALIFSSPQLTVNYGYAKID